MGFPIYGERDRLPDSPEHRRGLPQTRHAHTLPLRAQKMLEQQFSGLTEELVSNGAITINGQRLCRIRLTDLPAPGRFQG